MIFFSNCTTNAARRRPGKCPANDIARTGIDSKIFLT